MSTNEREWNVQTSIISSINFIVSVFSINTTLIMHKWQAHKCTCTCVLINCQIISTHFEKKIAKYELVFKCEGGIHLLEWKVVCWHNII